MQKMEDGDYQDGQTDFDKMQAGTVDTLDGKIVDAYKKIGVVLKTYRSGKLPKAFKVIPMVNNWEDLLVLTSPEKWSP
jgi:essential nuclear protein 1